MSVGSLGLGTVLASTTWYVNGVNGNDSNNCISSATPCKTIKHALALISTGDTIRIAPAIYPETGNRIVTNVKLLGSDAGTTIIDGGRRNFGIYITSTGAHVTISDMTIRNYVSGAGRHHKLWDFDSHQKHDHRK